MTDMIKADGVVLKTDQLGRMQTPVERREQILDEFERSGLSGKKFAELVGIKYQTLATWAEKRRRERGTPSMVKRSQPVRLLEAVVERAQPSMALVLHLPGGARVEIADASQAVLAAALVRALAPVMLSFSGSLKVFVAVEACDMRKGFNGLHALVTERLGEDPRQGALFVFTNRRHTRIKILCWDGTGLWVLTKRLEEGTFSWPKHLEPGVTKLNLTPQALAMLTDGVDLRGGKMRPWYERDDA